MNILILLLILLVLLILFFLFLLGSIYLLNASIRFVKWLINSLSDQIHNFISGAKVE